MFSTVLMPVTIFRSFVIVYLKREKDLLFLSSLSSFSTRLPGLRSQASASTGVSNSPERPQTAHLDLTWD